MNARVQIIPQSVFTASVNVWGVELECDYDYDEGEPPWFDEANPSPGSPPNAILYACRVGGVNIIEMLSESQRECIEEKLIEGAQS
jgi:hypothetical protein